MARPERDLKKLQMLKEAGVTEIAFNAEVFDKTIAAKIMPGKAGKSFEYYLESLRNAVKVFGKHGEVRSAFLVGLDDMDSFKKGIRAICEAGAAPILSLYRACENTPMENYISIDELKAMDFYEEAKHICDEYNVQIGPACQNNTLVMDSFNSCLDD